MKDTHIMKFIYKVALVAGAIFVKNECSLTKRLHAAAVGLAQVRERVISGECLQAPVGGEARCCRCGGGGRCQTVHRNSAQQ